jgi:hypothetical protein
MFSEGEDVRWESTCHSVTRRSSAARAAAFCDGFMRACNKTHQGSVKVLNMHQGFQEGP